MRKLMLMMALPALMLAGCGDRGSIASGGSTAPPGIESPAAETPVMDSINPIANTNVDEQGIRAAFRSLDLAATSIDILVATKVIVPKTPTALKVADGLDAARRWLNAASAAQRLGNSTNAREAFNRAGAAIAAVQDAIEGVK